MSPTVERFPQGVAAGSPAPFEVAQHGFEVRPVVPDACILSRSRACVNLGCVCVGVRASTYNSIGDIMKFCLLFSDII